MKIINKLTWRHLWANKKRTVITLFGIIISVAMVTAVFTSVESLMNTMGEITASYDGAWHAKYNELKSKDVQTLRQQRIHHEVQRCERLAHQRFSVDGQQSVFFFQFRILLKNIAPIGTMRAKKAEGRYHGTARGFSLCLYCGGIHAMLRKRADKLKIR